MAAPERSTYEEATRSYQYTRNHYDPSLTFAADTADAVLRLARR